MVSVEMLEHLTEEEKVRIQNVLEDEVTKSGKIRGLYAAGIEVKDIAKVLDVKYNFAYNVVAQLIRDGLVQSRTQPSNEIKPTAIETPVIEEKPAEIIAESPAEVPVENTPTEPVEVPTPSKEASLYDSLKSEIQQTLTELQSLNRSIDALANMIHAAAHAAIAHEENP